MDFNFTEVHVLVSLAGTPRSEVQEEVECAPSPHLSLTLKVRKPQTTEQLNISQGLEVKEMLSFNFKTGS